MTGADFRNAVGGLKTIEVDGRSVDSVSDMQKFKEIQK